MSLDPTASPDYQPHHIEADADHKPVAEPDDTNCEQCGLAYPGFGDRHGFGAGDAAPTTRPAHEHATAQTANAVHAQDGTDYPISGDKTAWRYAVPLGPAYREARDVDYGPRSTAHMGVLWGNPDDWRNLDAVSHESRRIVAVGRTSHPDSAQPHTLTTRADDDYCMHLSSMFLSHDDANGTTTYGCDACDSIWTEDDAN